MVQRCQESQRRTWCWSRPARPFAGLEGLLDGPAAARDGDQGGQRHGHGGVAAVVRQLAGADVPADEQRPLPGRGAPGSMVIQAQS